MIPDVDYITVTLDDKVVGQLAISNQRRCVFEYAREWIQNRFSVSPFHLPLRPGVFEAKDDPFDGLFGVFNDSLPDGWGNLLIDRWLRENGLDPARLNWLDRLSIVGKSGMGALCYEPHTERETKSEIRPLDFYAAEVEKILHEEPVESLDDLVEKAGSPGGARPKVLLTIDHKEWLIKFRASNDPSDMGEIEYQYSLAAKNAGIEMTETRLFEGKYFGAVRFDRDDGQRLHMVTASGLLHASHRYPSLDYVDLMKTAHNLTRSMIEVKNVYRLMVFNVLTFNRDDHAKNFSFLYQNDEWRLSPAYDLVYSSGFNGNHSTTINGQGNPDKNDLIEAGLKAGLDKSDCKRIYNETEEAVSEFTSFLAKRFRAVFL